jgi:hypothetical protein
VRNQGGDWERRARVPEEFEAALKAGKATDWYDDALYHYADWMANQGARRTGAWLWAMSGTRIGKLLQADSAPRLRIPGRSSVAIQR